MHPRCEAVAEALAHAHAANVVHRDIKPANILLSSDRVRVVDFGIARAFTTSAASQGLTSSGVQIGTLNYMSSEQAAGHGDVDRRTDIYALGCVLYEMIAGEPPFSGATQATVVARHVLDPVPSLRTVRPSVPQGLEDVVYKALAKSPSDRYQTANEMVGALAAAALEPEVSVSGVRQRRPLFRRRLAASLVVGALGAGAWGAWPVNAREEDSRSVAAADTSRLVLFPVTRGGGAKDDDDRLLRDAVLRWTGISVVDQREVTHAAVGDVSASAQAARKTVPVQ